MRALKAISRHAIPEALARAERYRLLNEPAQAESICQDILQVDAGIQDALVMLLLAVTDQFGDGVPAARALELVQRLEGEYERAYYAGIVYERQARSELKQGRFGSGPAVYDLCSRAMELFERAEALRPAGNDEALLRWNTCARLLDANPQVRPPERAATEPILSE